MRVERTRKRIFVSLLGASYLLIIVATSFMWWLLNPRLEAIHPDISLAMGAIILLIQVVIGTVFLLTTLTLIKGKEIIISQSLRRLIIIKILFPVAFFLGKLMRIPTEKIRRSFIEVNNSLVRAKNLRVSSNRLLLLMPRCIQFATCGVKITPVVTNCKRCGKCVINDLVGLKLRIDTELFVATGGTLARQMLEEKKPHAIVAVACERELVSGIQDSYPLPVIGIINLRPEGPCVNCQVDLKEVCDNIEYFLGPLSCEIKKAQEGYPEVKTHPLG